MKKMIIFLFGAIIFLVTFFYSLILWQIHIETALTLEKLNVERCDQLPSLSKLDELFTHSQSEVSEMLDNLSSCENNISVCDEYSKCKKEEYSKRKVRSGNTVIQWKKVPECGNQNKGAVLISYSSACELGKVENFINTNQNFYTLPRNYYNY